MLTMNKPEQNKGWAGTPGIVQHQVLFAQTRSVKIEM
ncbi:MAG: hypothetical protein K0R57_5235 [Paenibacillaceae bacterium]|jgi:hypothetical protein|nr:hypothetical protein [Paenibacillaceae bacterium]